MPATDSSKRFSYFGRDALYGGLNVADNPIIVDAKQLVTADNIAIKSSLARKKRGGLELYHTGSYGGTASFPTYGIPIRGIKQYFRYASTTGEVQSDLFLHQSTNVWSINTRTSPGVIRTGLLTLNVAGIPSYQVFDGVLFFTSTETADGYNKWDGLAPTAVAASGHPADGVGKYLQIHQGRMWMAGVPGFPFRLYYSQSLDPETWAGGAAGAAAGSFDLTAYGDPDGITAIMPSHQGSLYVSTRKTIFQITGIDATDFTITPVSIGVGAVNHQSVVAIPNDIVFLTDRGVSSLKKILLGDQTETKFLSRDIQPVFTNLLNQSLWDRAYATYDQNLNAYVLSCCSAGSAINDTTLVYNIEYGLWTVWTGINARSLSISYDSNKEKIVFGQENGRIALYNDTLTSDYSGDYAFNQKTGVLYPGGDITRIKRFLNVTVIASTTKASNLSVGWTIDGQRSGSKAIAIGQTSDLLGSTFILGSSRFGIAQYIPYTISIDDHGYGIQLSFTVGGPGDIEFYGFILEVETDENKRYT